MVNSKLAKSLLNSSWPSIQHVTVSCDLLAFSLNDAPDVCYRSLADVCLSMACACSKQRRKAGDRGIEIVHTFNARWTFYTAFYSDDIKEPLTAEQEKENSDAFEVFAKVGKSYPQVR